MFSSSTLNYRQTAAYTPRALTNDDIRRLGPSVFAETPWQSMSARYKFIPTVEVVEMLRAQSFLPVRAQQSRSRIPGKGDFTKHLLRFRHADAFTPQTIGQEIPELVLVNSHDGTAAYNFMAGIFRLACANGLIVQTADYGSLKVHHKGGSDFEQKVIDVSYEIMSITPKTTAQIQEWKQIELAPAHQTAFAAAALELRDNDQVQPEQILRPRRREDAPDPNGRRTLWQTMNTVQENIVKGGQQTVNPETRRRTKTREIKSVDADVKVNRALWLLTERMSQLV